jgi:hypothetical protein
MFLHVYYKESLRCWVSPLWIRVSEMAWICAVSWCEWKSTRIFSAWVCILMVHWTKNGIFFHNNIVGSSFICSIYEVFDSKNCYFLYSIPHENVQQIKIRLCVIPYFLGQLFHSVILYGALCIGIWLPCCYWTVLFSIPLVTIELAAHQLCYRLTASKTTWY